MSESAERRAQRKLWADAYKRLPPRETLQAAAELERAKMQRQSQNDQMALQKASLAVGILSQVPRDDENNKPLFHDARDLLQRIIKNGIAQMDSPRDIDEDDTSEDDEGGDSAAL